MQIRSNSFFTEYDTFMASFIYDFIDLNAKNNGLHIGRTCHRYQTLFKLKLNILI